MKIIDKTPFLDEKGELGLMPRIQGMLQFGFGWPSELQAQKAIITFFDRQLEKGYTLIRNMTLGQSGIMIPIILVGPAGIFVIQVAFMRGRYEARGDTWNVESGSQYQPAPVNMIQVTLRMARALKVFIERQGAMMAPFHIEPVLIAGDPGLHIDSVRPAVRVMMIDGIKSFATGLATAQPVLSPEAVYELTERISNPHPPKTGKEPLAPPQAAPPDDWEPYTPPASFDTSAEAKPFSPSDFDFAMTDEEPSADIPPVPSASSSAAPSPRPAAPSSRILGMTPPQLAVIAGLGLAFLCILAVFAYIFFSAS